MASSAYFDNPYDSEDWDSDDDFNAKECRDLTLNDARDIARDLKENRKIASYMFVLQNSRVTIELLEKTELAAAVARHANHEGCGQLVRRTMLRLKAISRGLPDNVNDKFYEPGGNWSLALKSIERRKASLSPNSGTSSDSSDETGCPPAVPKNVDSTSVGHKKVDIPPVTKKAPVKPAPVKPAPGTHKPKTFNSLKQVQKELEKRRKDAQKPEKAAAALKRKAEAAMEAPKVKKVKTDPNSKIKYAPHLDFLEVLKAVKIKPEVVDSSFEKAEQAPVEVNIPALEQESSQNDEITVISTKKGQKAPTTFNPLKVKQEPKSPQKKDISPPAAKKKRVFMKKEPASPKPKKETKRNKKDATAPAVTKEPISTTPNEEVTVISVKQGEKDPTTFNPLKVKKEPKSPQKEDVLPTSDKPQKTSSPQKEKAERVPLRIVVKQEPVSPVKVEKKRKPREKKDKTQMKEVPTAKNEKPAEPTPALQPLRFIKNEVPDDYSVVAQTQQKEVPVVTIEEPSVNPAPQPLMFIQNEVPDAGHPPVSHNNFRVKQEPRDEWDDHEKEKRREERRQRKDENRRRRDDERRQEEEKRRINERMRQEDRKPIVHLEVLPTVVIGPRRSLTPAEVVAQKLNELPQIPEPIHFSELLKTLKYEVLIEAEKLIGRQMGRVDRIWWELLYRDFGRPTKKWACPIREVYQAHVDLSTFMKKQKEEEERQKQGNQDKDDDCVILPPPPPPPF